MICSCCVHQSTLFLRTSRPLDRAAFPLPYTEEHAASFLHYDATLTVPINMAIVDTTTASDSIVGGVGLTVAASPLLRTAHRGTLVFWTGMPYAGKGVVRLPETRLTTGRMCVCVGGVANACLSVSNALAPSHRWPRLRMRISTPGICTDHAIQYINIVNVLVHKYDTGYCGVAAICAALLVDVPTAYTAGCSHPSIGRSILGRAA